MLENVPLVKPVIRVTSLLTWHECKYKYYLSSQGWRLKPGDGSGLSPQVSGSAVHFGIEAGLLNTSGRNKLSVAIEAADAYIARLGAGRYSQGVHTAIQGVPPEIWETHNPQAEQRVSVEYDKFILTGKPDLWTYEPDAIVITDFKSTSKDEGSRLEKLQLFNMQVRYYGVLLTAWLISKGHEPPPVYTRHIVLSTRGKHVYGVPQLMTNDLFQKSAAMMMLAADDITYSERISFLEANVSPACSWCEFQDICVGHLTGSDTDDIMRERYRKDETAVIG